MEYVKASGTYEQGAAMVMHYDPFLMMTTVLMAAGAAVLLGLGMSANKHESKDTTLKGQEQCDGEHCGHSLTRDDSSD